MKALDVDFMRSNGPSRGLWLWLMISAIALATIQAYHLYALKRDYIRETRRLSELTKISAPKIELRAPAPETLVAARKVLALYATPWERLFEAIEAAHVDGVTLLSVEPDAGEGKVVISASAQEFLDVMNYVTRLQEAGTLFDVHLTHYETHQETGRSLFQFSVAARWAPGTKK